MYGKFVLYYKFNILKISWFWACFENLIWRFAGHSANLLRILSESNEILKTHSKPEDLKTLNNMDCGRLLVIMQIIYLIYK